MLTLTSPYKFKAVSFLLVPALICGNYYVCPNSFADTSDLNFKVYNPDQSTAAESVNTTPEATNTAPTTSTPEPIGGGLTEEKPVNDATQVIDQATAPDSATETANKPDAKPANETDATGEKKASATEDESKGKVLQGYVRVVPSGTKMAIIMDTAVDSDTSQEGDEFTARTAEDLTIDGATVVPAGSIIRGRIMTLNAPKHLNRSGSVALKFDSVTTPDNRQIPLVANLVARGGVVHARRGIKDVAIDTATFTLPTAVALGIGAVAGHSSSSVGVGGGALIGAGIGAAIGVAILLAKKGKRVDVRPGDELRIELAEDLHMPTM